MNSYYNQDYTEEDITKILETIKECIRNNNYTIAMNENRQENINFINEYNIRSDRQKSILLQLQTDDFCYTLKNTKIGYEYEVLYVFVQLNLLKFKTHKKCIVVNNCNALINLNFFQCSRAEIKYTSIL